MTSTSATAPRERMSRVDTAWLRMDNDVNLMMIVGVWLLTPAIDYETLCRRVEERLLRYDRFATWWFAMRAARTGATTPASISTIKSSATSSCEGKGQSERAALQERVGVLASEPLDPRRPLWQFHLIDGYEGGSALIARVHHCIGDGIALISVMMAITDGGSEPPRRERRAKDGDDGADWLADAVLKPLGGLSAKAAALAEASVARALEVLADPQQGLAGTSRARASAPR
jgi:hypothetical protein